MRGALPSLPHTPSPWSCRRLSCFQGVPVRGILSVGALGWHPRLRARRLRLERRPRVPERSAHGHPDLSLPATAPLRGADGTLPEAVQAPASQQEALQGTHPRGATAPPGTGRNVRRGGGHPCRREAFRAAERKVSGLRLRLAGALR